MQDNKIESILERIEKSLDLIKKDIDNINIRLSNIELKTMQPKPTVFPQEITSPSTSIRPNRWWDYQTMCNYNDGNL